jgi:hypothetical protein
MNDGLVECPGCKAPVPEGEGLTHPYIGANAGCWGLYSEVLGREYQDGDLFHKIHRMTVDAYAVQHPGKPEKRTIQSLNVHLVALYLVLEKGVSPSFVTQAMARLIKEHSSEFEWLEPPANPGDVKLIHVWLAETPNEHVTAVQSWARSVWAAWHPHRAKIEALASTLLPN